MTVKPRINWRYWALRAVASLLALALLATQATAPVTAGSGDRTLWLYHTHTHETAKFTFKHNGQFDQKVLAQMNTFLADWRTHRPTHMDPHLFDLLWEVYQDVGGQQPYNIVSSYREPKTNAMLRARSKMVAENSQHMLGKAMDVFIPGVPLPVLRAAAMRHQVGGVGYYPTSGSPFVHMDTGNVRAWPRMTRAQLKTVFPDGKTLHLPVDGTPLSNEGRQYAMVQWNKCHMVPCNGDGSVPAAVETDDEIRVAITPFGQVDGGHNRWREGTGLGLPIAEALVKLHGGELSITSTKGAGTTVTVRLPAYVTPEPAVQMTAITTPVSDAVPSHAPGSPAR